MAYITVEVLTDFANKFAVKITDIFARKTEIPTTLPASGGDSDTVNGHTVNADVPEGAKFTDTTYKNMTGASTTTSGKSGLVPAPEAGAADRYLCSDGTFKQIEEATTTDIDSIIAGTFNS